MCNSHIFQIMYKRCMHTYIYNVCISYLYLQWPYIGIYIYIFWYHVYIYTAWVSYVLYTLDMLYSNAHLIWMYIICICTYVFRSIVPSIRLHINLVICRAVFLLNVMLRLGIVWKKPSKNDLSGHLWRMGRVCSRRQGAKRVNRLTVWPWIRIHLTRLLGVDVVFFQQKREVWS